MDFILGINYGCNFNTLYAILEITNLHGKYGIHERNTFAYEFLLHTVSISIRTAGVIMNYETVTWIAKVFYFQLCTNV